MNPNQNLTRVVVVSEDSLIVIEEFKNADNKIVRQASFTKEQLTAMRKNLDTQYDAQEARLVELLSKLA